MILLSYGTRPEYIKVKPLIDEFAKRDIPIKVLCVEQHFGLSKDADLKIPVLIRDDRLSSIMASISLYLPKLLKDNGVDRVLVQGDTASAVYVAQVAFNCGVPVVHLEAGMRTFDNNNPWPEESYRRIISAVADVHLCSTHEDMMNLEIEMIDGDYYVTGNTSIDNLVSFRDDCEYTNKVLVTMHRRENHDKMGEWFEAIDNLAASHPNLEFIFPVHWNPNVRKHADILKHVTVVDPLSHKDLIKLLVKTRLVITDSGGLQEESSFFNKKCLVCRQKTERVGSLGTSSFLVLQPSDLLSVFALHVNDYEIDFECPYGDGNSSNIILNILKNYE